MTIPVGPDSRVSLCVVCSRILKYHYGNIDSVKAQPRTCSTTCREILRHRLLSKKEP